MLFLFFAFSTGTIAAPVDPTIIRSEQVVQIPSVALIDNQERRINLDALLNEQRPVIVQFIFTSCTTICGVLASTLAAAQTELDSIRSDYLALSITIDPEYDTPARLKEFSESFPPDNHWRLLTGGRNEIGRVLEAFGARSANGTKDNHQAYTYIRGLPGKPWTRIEGLISCKQLISEYRAVVERN